MTLAGGVLGCFYIVVAIVFHLDGNDPLGRFINQMDLSIQFLKDTSALKPVRVREDYLGFKSGARPGVELQLGLVKLLVVAVTLFRASLNVYMIFNNFTHLVERYPTDRLNESRHVASWFEVFVMCFAGFKVCF